MKLIDFMSSTYIDFGVEDYDADPKIKDGDHVGLSNIKTFSQKTTF